MDGRDGRDGRDLERDHTRRPDDLSLDPGLNPGLDPVLDPRDKANISNTKSASAALKIYAADFDF